MTTDRGLTFNRAFEVHGIYRFPSIPCLNLLLEERLANLELEAKLAPNDDPHRPMKLFSIGCTLFIRYEQNGSLEELNVAVAVIEESLNGQSNRVHQYPRLFINKAIRTYTIVTGSESWAGSTGEGQQRNARGPSGQNPVYW